MKKKILIYSGIILFILLSCEIITRYLKLSYATFDRKFPATATRNPKPYIMFKGAENVSGHNRYGYRGEAPGKDKTENEYRIFILGGSTVYTGDPSIPSLVQEEYIKNGHNRVVVFNYGVISSVSSMELARIVFEILDFRPDLIVMYNGANDMTHPLYWDPRPGFPFNFIVYENNPLIFRSIKKSLLLLLYQSNILNITGRNYFIEKFLNFEKVRQGAGYNSEYWREEIADIYVKNLIKAARISKAFGSDFIVFFQPMAYFKDNLSARETRFINKAAKEHHLYLRGKILSKIKDANLRHDLKFADLSDIYDDNKETVFTDEVHTKQEAMPAAAKAIYEYLARWTVALNS